MAITFVSATSSSTLVGIKPTGVVAGDVCVALVSSYEDTGTVITGPAEGWTLQHRADWDGFITSATFTRVMTGSDVSNPTWTSSSAFLPQVLISAYRGVDNTTPWDTTATDNAADLDGHPTGLSITTATAGALLLYLITMDGSAGTGLIAVPSGFSAIRAGGTGEGGVTNATAICDFTQSSAGASGNQVGTSGVDYWVVTLGALRPDGGAPPSVPNQQPTIFPDAIRRPGMLAAHHYAASDVLPPPAAPTVPTQFPTSFPDMARRPGMLAPWQLATSEVAPQPERKIHNEGPTFPDRIVRATLPIAAFMAFAMAPMPERTHPLASEQHVDAVVRPKLHASQQLAATNEIPRPERTAPLADVSFPERVARPFYAPRFQQDSSDVSPLPILNTLVLGEDLTSHPDAVARAAYRTGAQQDSSDVPPLPVVATLTTGWDPVFPSRHVYIRLPLTGYQSLAFAPQPEQTGALASAIFPHAVPRPFYKPVEQQDASDVPSKPEQTASLACEVNPDRVARPSFHASQQLASTELSPVPERTSPLVSEQHVDRIDRPSLHASRHLAVSGEEPQPEDGIDLDWQGEWPDKIARPTVPTTEQPGATPAGPPERTAALAATYAPDQVRRPSLHASEQLAVSELSPQPELPIALTWIPSYPASTPRPFVLTAEQLAHALYPVPILNTLPMQQPVWYPDAVRRPSLVAAEQVAFALAPYPLVPQITQFPTAFPDAIRRPSFLAAQQVATSEISPKPEQPTQLSSTVFPDTVIRPRFGTAQQLASTELSPKVELTSPLTWLGAWPDAVTRPRLHASAQLGAGDLAPQPEVTVALSWAPAFPDRVVRAREHASEQAASVLVQLVTAPLQALTWYPDGVVRPSLRVSEQLAASDMGPLPIPNVLAWLPTYPERIRRPALRADEQLAQALAPFPLANAIPPESFAIYPDGVVRPSRRTALCSTFTSNVFAIEAPRVRLPLTFDYATQQTTFEFAERWTTFEFIVRWTKFEET